MTGRRVAVWKKRTMVSACACVQAPLLGFSDPRGIQGSTLLRDIGVRSEEEAWWVGL